jgi:hypothetical protein
MQSELAVLKEDFEDFGSDIKNKVTTLSTAHPLHL